MSYERRAINLIFQMGKGSFGASGFDTVRLEGLRVACGIVKAGGVSMAQCQLRVYGMSLSDMNALSTLGKPLLDGRDNRVTVEVGTADGATVAFIGTIQEAYVDAQSAPDVAFIVHAFTGLLDALRPIAPSSFRGQADVSNIFAGLATQMGLTYENSGVSVQLSNPYFPGTALSQVQAAAQAANVNYLLDDGVLAVWPKGGSRGGAIPLLSPETGLVGYPQHTENGIRVTTLYNPAIQFGGRVQVESSLTPARGTWTVFSVQHELASELPGGPWFTTLDCSVLGYAQPLPR